jgi:hypothetical protein
LLADANGRILDRLAGLEKVITPQLAQQALSETKGKKPGTVPEFFSTQQASGGRFEA